SAAVGWRRSPLSRTLAEAKNSYPIDSLEGASRMPPEHTAVDQTDAGDLNSRRRRDDAKWRRVEAAVEGLVRPYELPSRTAPALNEWIYRLSRILARLKSRDDQDRYYREWRGPIRNLAERTANAPDTEPSAYVADMREFAAHMIRLEALERRSIGRGKA